MMLKLVVLFVFAIAVQAIDNKLTIVDEPNLPALPGVKSTITQNGVTYLSTVGVQVLEQFISTVSIPDISGSVGTPIGSIDYTLSSITLDTLQLPQNSITINPGSGLTLSITDATCELHLNWHYRKHSWPHISDSGSADIDGSSISIDVEIQITEDNNLPYLSVVSNTVYIGSLDIHLHGGASWLYQIFVNVFGDQIRKAADSALADAITQNINNGANTALSQLPVQIPINKEVEINYALLSNPVFGNGYLSLPDAGEFYSISNPQECPGSVCPEPNIPDILTTDMVNLIVSEYSANSAGLVYLQIGKLDAHVFNSQIPSWAPIKLNTSSFKFLVPGLYEEYPNQLMELHIYATIPPVIDFTSSGAVVQVNGSIDVLIELANGSLPLAFQIGGAIHTSGIVLLDGTTAYGNLTFIKGDFFLQSTNVGEFSMEAINDILNLLFTNGVLPAVNEDLRSGIPLPTIPGVTFSDPSLVWGEGYVAVSTDIQYTPPSLEIVE